MKFRGTFVDSVVRERSELKFSRNTGNLQEKSPHFNLKKSRHFLGEKSGDL